MRRKLNLKFALWLAVGIIAFGGSLALAHHLQYQRIPLALLRQAQKAEDEKDLKRLESYLTRYVEFVPDDVEQKSRRAKLLASPPFTESYRALERAFGAIEDVLARDPGKDELRKLVIPLAIKLRRMDTAAEHLRKLQQSAPKDGATHQLWGEWCEAKNQIDQAITSYREAVAVAPQDSENYVRLARLLRMRAGEDLSKERRATLTQEADQVMDRLVANNQQSWQARVARWTYRREHTLPRWNQNANNVFGEVLFLAVVSEFTADTRKALELAEGEADVRLACSEAAQLEGNLDEARTHLDKAMQLHRQEARVYQGYSRLEQQIELSKQDAKERSLYRAKSLDWLRQGAKELRPPTQSAVQWTLANRLLERNDPKEVEEAAQLIKGLRAANLEPANIDFLQGRLLLVRQQWPDAARLLERARPVVEDRPEMADLIDLYLGQCYGQLNDANAQLAAYSRMAKRNPLSLAARLGMAEANRAKGDIDKAMEQYRLLAGSGGPADSAWAEHIRLMIVRTRQNGPTADWNPVDAAIAQAARDRPDRGVDLAILRAGSLMARGKPDKAAEELTVARRTHWDKVEIWTAQAALAERVRDPKKALEVLDEAETVFKEPKELVELRVARASVLVGHRDEKTVEGLKKLEAGVEKFPAKERNRLFNALAEAHYHAANYADAGRLWGALAEQEEYKNDLRLRLVVFDLALQEGKDAEMRQALEKIRALEGGEGTYARHAESLRLIWLVRTNKLDGEKRREALEQASALTNQVIASRSSWSAGWLARAEIEMLRGNTDQAIKSYNDALRLGDRSPLVLRKLVETLRLQKKYREADQLLGTLTRDELTRAELERQAAELSLINKNPDRAIDLAQDAVRNDSLDYRDHLWVGQLLAASGKKPEVAEVHLKRAAQLGEKEPSTWVALVRFLVAQNRGSDAETVLTEAREKLPPEELPLALAQCYAAMNKPKEAREQFEAARAARPRHVGVLREFASFHLSRSEMKEAEALLRATIDGTEKLTEEDAEWVHSRLALLLSAGEGSQLFREALKHVGLKVDDAGNFGRDGTYALPDTPQMQRTAARVLATQSQWRVREEAVKRFESLERRQDLTVDDRYVLSRLYESQGAWSKAREQLSIIANSPERKVHYLASYAQMLLRQKEKDEARRIIDRLEEIYKARPTPGLQVTLIDLQARWHEANNEVDKAIELLKARLTSRGSEPQEVLLLVSCLGRQKRFDVALGLLDRVWQACPPEQAGGTSVALLRSAKATDQQRQAVLSRLESALQKEPANAALLVQVGDVHDLSGDFRRAEEKYREALRHQPNNVMALNNLAWLLAQRSGKGDEALQVIDRAIRFAGQRGELLDTRAIIYLTLNRVDDAIADLKDATKETMTPTRCFHLALACHKAGKREEAIRLLRQAKALGLQTSDLHPVEQTVHRKLHEELQVR